MIKEAMKKPVLWVLVCACSMAGTPVGRSSTLIGRTSTASGTTAASEEGSSDALHLPGTWRTPALDIREMLFLPVILGWRP